MENLSIDIIKEKINSGKVRWTNHAISRLFQRNIMQKDVQNALLNGEIIEEYKDDYPYPSCLVYGISVNNKILHIVCGFNGEELWIITAYYPNRDEWNEDMKTRKESK